MNTQASERVFLQGPRTCPFACKYCFAEFSCFQEAKPRLDIREATQGKILYPSCDTEVGLSASRIDEIAEFANTLNAIAVSISTKRKPSEGFLSALVKLDEKLYGLGVLLKVSISVSTKYQISDIEKGASQYAERLEMASQLRKHGIATSVNLKPVLPFIQISEYLEIVDDFFERCSDFLLGGLYLDRKTQFGKEIIEEYPDLILNRCIEWMPGQPLWTTCYDNFKIDKILDYISDLGGCGYLSDRHFVFDILSRKQNGASKNSGSTRVDRRASLLQQKWMEPQAREESIFLAAQESSHAH